MISHHMNVLNVCVDLGRQREGGGGVGEGWSPTKKIHYVPQLAAFLTPPPSNALLANLDI